jgi:pilus assembly protein Flp/PilA
MALILGSKSNLLQIVAHRHSVSTRNSRKRTFSEIKNPCCEISSSLFDCKSSRSSHKCSPLSVSSSPGKRLEIHPRFGERDAHSDSAVQTACEAFMKNLFLRLWREESGQDLTEYALLIVLVALAAIASMKSLATAISTAFASAASNLTSTT